MANDEVIKPMNCHNDSPDTFLAIATPSTQTRSGRRPKAPPAVQHSVMCRSCHYFGWDPRIQGPICISQRLVTAKGSDPIQAPHCDVTICEDNAANPFNPPDTFIDDGGYLQMD